MSYQPQKNSDSNNLNNQQQRAQYMQQLRQSNFNNQYVNDRNYPSGGYPPKTNTYLPMGPPNPQYPGPNGPGYQQPYQGQYAQQNQYPPNSYQMNYQQVPQYNYPPEQYAQQQINPNTPPQQNYGPNIIPPNSPLFRHRLSQVNQMFSPQFQKKFEDNESYKSLNDFVIFTPSFLIMAHVIGNRNKKWFRLTANPRAIRYSILGLLGMHLCNRILYTSANRHLIATNRQKIEKIVVRQQFLSGGKTDQI